FDTSRCIVPMSAFYEWKKEGSQKVPYRIFLKNEKFFFVPALYVEKEREFYASLITTTPNRFIEKIHHRMPVILKINEALEYLKNDSEINLARCIPFASDEEMEMERAAF
ncbi:MAG: SOS response-associated peptidase family protein, partial [Syntrophothermus sp.]